MMMKPICSGSARRSCTSSRRSGGDSAGRRLVEQDEARRAGERHADLQLPLLAVRQICDQLVRDLIEAHGVGQFARIAAPRRPSAVGRSRDSRPRVTPRAARYRLSMTGQPAEQHGVLVGAPQAAADALVGRQLRDVFAEEAHATAGGRKVAGDRVEQRGLARPVGTEDPRRSPAPTVRSMPCERDERAESPAHALEDEGVSGAGLARVSGLPPLPGPSNRGHSRCRTTGIAGCRG